MYLILIAPNVIKKIKINKYFYKILNMCFVCLYTTGACVVLKLMVN